MLATLLNLEQQGDNLFRSNVHQLNFRQTLFGGQVLAQALLAAGQTVSGRPPHSLHAYFLRPGTGAKPVLFEVDNLRDGGSVSSRSVRVLQEGETILTMLASFHRPEAGFHHQVEQPQDLADPDHELSQALPTVDWLDPRLLDLRLCTRSLFDDEPQKETVVRAWMKCGDPLPSVPLLHYCALAFASDVGLLASAFMQQKGHLLKNDVFAASMDHALWFHAEPNFNDWLACSMESPWANDGRALCKGQIFDKNGRQLASCAQEGLIRRL